MLLSPSLSPSPLDSPSTTTISPPPPLPPPPPLLSPTSPPLPTPHLAPTSTPPILQPPAPVLPVTSPPPPPASIAISPITTPPSPVVTTPPPQVVTSPPPTPPAAITISPVASPPPPALLPRSSPQPPKTLPSPPPPLILSPPSLPPPKTLPSPPPSLILPPPLTTPPSLPPPFTSISPPASPVVPAASHSIKAPKTPGPFQAFPPPAPPSIQSFPTPAPPPTLALTGQKGGLSTTKQTPHAPIGLIVSSIGVGILLFAVLAVALVCICCKGTRRRKKKNSLNTEKQQCSVTKVSIQHKQGNVVNAATGPGSINASTLVADNTTLNSSIDGIFTYEELVIATNGFSESNLLGQGGFGYVYKGQLPTGQDVAVKKLKAGSRQGEREFRAEVETISRVHHKHLVSLVGYCINGDERLLVYEFVTNKTLEFHLYENGEPVMVWESRLKIAIGTAKGLAYLHEDCSPTIIHRDIKAANILLDMRFEAKVSDFGLAKIFFDSSSSITHISTRVMGTFGYLAPEYALTGKVTDKSDVYSYGVVLLELITGRPPIIEQDSSTNQSLVDWARPLLARALEDNDFDTLVDLRLNGSYNKIKMSSMVSCAAACTRQSARLRPRMIQVVRALEDDISLPYLNEGTRFSNSSSNASSDTFIRNAERCIINGGFSEHYESNQ